MASPAPPGSESDPAAKQHRPERQSRWSEGKYCNMYVPNYVPPEFMIFDNGTPLDVFLARAQLEDLKRLSERAAPELYFMRRNGPLNIPAKYDAHGRRMNTPQQVLMERKEKLTRELQDRSKRFNRLGATGEREIVRKVYFTPQQMESKSYGAILGSRGATHQKLESETGCRIVLAGRGITDMKKAINLRHYDQSNEMATDRPHCRITAPSESALQKAVERIEWILSDTPEAIRFRDDVRKRLAIDNGTYDPKTWVPTPIPGSATSAAAPHVDDAEVEAFIRSTLNENASVNKL